MHDFVHDYRADPLAAGSYIIILFILFSVLFELIIAVHCYQYFCIFVNVVPVAIV